MKEQGFKSSPSDPCLFIKNYIIIITYAENFLIFSKDEKGITDLTESLKQQFKLTNEGAMQAFLGIDFKNFNKECQMTQPYLIRRILKALGLEKE